MTGRMLVEAWSDVVCPWCAVGKAHLERALAGFEHADVTDVVWRSFELDPGAPPVREGAYADGLARRYGTSPAGGRAMTARMSHAAELAGLTFRFDLARPTNSFDAHRLLHLAAAHHLQGPLTTLLLEAHLARGAVLSDHPTLQGLAEQVGLPADRVAAVLATQEYADAVRADEADGLRRGVTAVPTFLVDGRHAIPGAQSADSMLATLRRAWSRRELPREGLQLLSPESLHRPDEQP